MTVKAAYVAPNGVLTNLLVMEAAWAFRQGADLLDYALPKAP